MNLLPLPMWPIDARLDLHERWGRLRLNYATLQRAIDAGEETWTHGDPYQIADWVSLFTPIETAAWGDLRYAGLPMWPQYPVGRYFLDFANPVVKIALECDGAQWHDSSKDAKRDAWLEQRGWRIFRAPGWRCNRLMEQPDNWGEMGREEREAWTEAARTDTLRGLIAEMRPYFRGDRL